jgi:putative Mg2+ transporter-C (MgtC) family protein
LVRPARFSMTIPDITLRLAASVLVGSAIGLNRDLRGKPAGVRTHALVSLGAAVATLAVAGINDDPAATSRVIQGIITGIGFLGAGVILHPDGGRSVRGLTTAATIWISATLGLACGVAAWPAVAIGTACTLVILVLGGPVERLLHRMLGREVRGTGQGPETG